MPSFARASDAIGTVHDSCFVVLSEQTLLFLADFDGDEVQLLRDLAEHAGQCSMPSGRMCTAPRRRPSPGTWRLSSNGRCIIASVPSPPTQPIRPRRCRASIEVAAEHLRGTGEQLPFLVILPLRSRVSEGSSGSREASSPTLPQHRRLHFASLVLLDAHKLASSPSTTAHSTNSCRLSPRSSGQSSICCSSSLSTRRPRHPPGMPAR